MAPAGYGDRVEGVHAVTAALAADRVEKLYVDRSRLGREGIASIMEAAGGLASVVDDVRPIAQTDSPQGVVADCRPITPVTLESLTSGTPSLLVLDHVEDPHNVGAIARSALAAGCSGLVVSDRRAAPLSAVAFKAAAGALETIPVAVVGSIPEALRRLQKHDVWIVGLDSAGDQSLFGLELLTEPVAVVVGSEGSGLSRLAGELCDVVVSIPMPGQIESLNASVSAALAAFEIMRIRSAPG
ncbi:MAG: 23S rRNA (guanosine(2251)-2'-O)-methyltransferase RlmB [Acidimicrobiia bacterium]|nr:23S rRNA (guanosine(2251)-2'-O)-methyltransferase RlmB [Acidimicrobiia bacterium]